MDNALDLISVIVTNYNHAKYLPQRMESLLKQTYPKLEIIIIDNCSTDNSREVLDIYKYEPHIKVVYMEKNIGNINTSNMGVDLSKGKFFIFAEADDYSDPQEIELLYKAMAGNENIGAAFCRSNMVDSEGRKFGEDVDYRDKPFKEYCSKDTLIPGDLAQHWFLYSCIIPNFSAVLFRRKYYDLAGRMTHDFKTCADWDFWFRMSGCCDLYYLVKPLNYFRRHAQTTGNIYGIQLTLTEIMRMLYRESAKANLSFWENLHFKINLGVIWGRYRTPDPATWWKCFPTVWRESLKYDPLSVLYLALAFIKRSTQRTLKIA